MILTPADLHDLTGYVRPSAQARWLRRHGWRFLINTKGLPVVASAEFDRRRKGRVYVIVSRDLVKIGVSENIERRLKGLRCANPHIESVAYVSDGYIDAYRIEAEAHQKLRRHRVTGEWFRCSVDVAIEAVRSLASKGRPLMKKAPDPRWDLL